MTTILISIVITAVIIMAAIIVARREAKKYGTSTKEEFVGICASAIETASQKEVRKQKALAMFQEQSASAKASADKKLSNAEIRASLGVSSRTAVRYLDELEKEGKV
ncbi:MAG: hypothetical protein HYT27_03435, partial [Parcubacteria group bacterium]|nr:hypothetical protein [Parcubacteria group bacterium]